ncbi:MAG TPA: energy-coupling factor transporter transmembrane protein EcfT, partial [Actinomycetes bacterium]
RGRPHTGLRGLRGVAMPVLEGALERSIELAAAMDSRGFGRTAAGGRKASGGVTLAGLLGVCAGLYGLLDAGSPVAMGLPLLAAGAALATVGLWLGGRRATRSRYRPDHWGAQEWLVGGAGLVAAATALVAGALWPEALAPSTSPLVVPTLPVVPVLGLLVARLPAWIAPPPEPRGAPEPGTDRHARVEVPA